MELEIALAEEFAASIEAGEPAPHLNNEQQALAVRRFCVEGLANSVPHYMKRDVAADLVCEWFPGDKLALASLYRQIKAKSPYANDNEAA